MSLSATNFSLPEAKDEYSREDFQALVSYVRELESAAYLRDNHVEVYGDLDAGSRQPLFILRSPDGTRWSVTVDNSGVLGTTDIGDLGL